jgi:hypothetical protein
MRAGDLLGASVFDTDGRRRGAVIEIRTRGHGGADQGEVLVVDGFVVGTHRWRLFGYERTGERGPAIFRAAVRLLHKNTHYAPFGEVDIEAGKGLRLHTPWHELPALHEISG